MQHITIITFIATLATWVASQITNAQPYGYHFVFCWIASAGIYALYVSERRSIEARKDYLRQMDNED